MDCCTIYLQKFKALNGFFARLIPGIRGQMSPTPGQILTGPIRDWASLRTAARICIPFLAAQRTETRLGSEGPARPYLPVKATFRSLSRGSSSGACPPVLQLPLALRRWPERSRAGRGGVNLRSQSGLGPLPSQWGLANPAWRGSPGTVLAPLASSFGWRYVGWAGSGRGPCSLGR